MTDPKHESVWVDELPTCDICEMVEVIHPAQYDCKTTAGPWANACDEHFEIHGIGLGLGRGQKLLERTKLECGHRVAIHVGAVVFDYYDGGFGTVVEVGESRFERVPWHRVMSHGAPHWPEGSVTLLDASRLCCVKCADDQLARHTSPRHEKRERGDGRIEVVAVS